jgi:hypothetical protein
MEMGDVWRRRGLGKLAGSEALPGYEDRDAGFTSDEERLIAEVLGCAVGVDTGGALVPASVASGENVDAEATAFEGFGERDGERRFAGAAGGEIADADYGKAQTAHWLQPGAEAELAQKQGEAVGGDQREEKLAR